MPEYQLIEKNEKVAKRNILDFVSFRSGLNIELLKKRIELENERVLLVPFEDIRNEELKEIIFDDGIWKYMGMYVREEMDFENYKRDTLKSKKENICYPFLIIDKLTNKIAGSTRYGYLNFESKKCEIGWTWYGKEFQGTGLNKACKYERLCCMNG